MVTSRNLSVQCCKCVYTVDMCSSLAFSMFVLKALASTHFNSTRQSSNQNRLFLKHTNTNQNGILVFNSLIPMYLVKNDSFSSVSQEVNQVLYLFKDSP